MKRSQRETAELLREHLTVVNAYMFAELGYGLTGMKPRVLVVYWPRDHGRGGRGARWQVHDLDKATDPKAHWQDYGRQTYSVFDLSRKGDVRDEALAFAAKWSNVPATDWVELPRVPFFKDAWVPRPVRDEVLAALELKITEKELTQG